MNRQILILVGCLLCSALPRGASAADPLYLLTPYDEITLNEDNGNVLLKVKLLNLPGRKVPDVAARAGDLDVELLDRPGEKFKIEWAAITSVTLFEQMVLAEAEQHVKAQRFDDAYPYFQFLETRFSHTAGLKEAIENFLWVQIGGAFKAGRHDEALALLVELYGRNPQRAGINIAYERVTNELVKKHLAAENYRAVRGLLRNLGERFPDTKAATVAPYETQLQGKAAMLLAEAKTLLAAGKRREAHQTCSRMLEVWPAIDGGQQLALSIHQQHPLVIVGVTSPLATAGLATTDDWSLHRAGRLLGRPLVELGEVAPGDDSSQLLVKLTPGTRGLDPGRDVSAHDVVRCLLARADPAHAAFDSAWADVFAGVTVQSAADVLIAFRQPQLKPASWLATPLFSGSGADALRLGPYAIDGQSPEQVNFVKRADYSAAGPQQPGEIVERTYRDSALAIRALRRGEISVIDRISPWDLPRLTSGGEFVVEPYASPRVHLLVPNSRRPLTASRTFRRALVYGIDRQGISNRGILDGQTIAGCEVVSGPFPRGPAYNEQVENRPYDPGLALALVRMTVDEVNSDRQAGGEAPLESPPKIVLAHRAEPIARVACQSIARQLRLLGLSVAVRELAPEEQPSPEVDLLYAEAAMREPIVDVWRWLGPQGFSGNCSPAILAALRSLDSAADEGEAAAKLQEIHRLAAAELPIIPLWQLVDHLAYHKSVQGIGQRPVGLYDKVEGWQVEFRIPPQ